MKRGQIQLLIFCAVHLFLSSYFLDFALTPNPTSRVVSVLALVENGTLSIDPYEKWAYDKTATGGHFYSDKAPLPALLVTPVFWFLRRTGIVGVDPAHYEVRAVSALGNVLCGSFPFTLILCFAFIAVRRKTSFLPAAILSTLPFYGSFLFAYAGTFFGHLMAAMFVLASLITLERDEFVVSGLLLSAATLCEYSLGLAMPLWAAQVLWRTGRCKDFLRFSLGCLPGVIGLGLYNAWITGNPFVFSYAYHADPEAIRAVLGKFYGFRLPTLAGVWGLVFSRYRGALVFAPALVLMAIVYFLKSDMRLKSKLQNPAIAFCAAHFTLISSYYYWDGGWCYGPRYLTPVVAVLLYKGVLLLAAQKKSIYWNYLRGGFLVLCLFGIVTCWMDKVTLWYMLPSGNLQPLSALIWPAFWAGKFERVDLVSLLLGPGPVLGALLWFPLFVGGLWITARFETRSMGSVRWRRSKAGISRETGSGAGHVE